MLLSLWLPCRDNDSRNTKCRPARGTLAIAIPDDSIKLGGGLVLADLDQAGGELVHGEQVHVVEGADYPGRVTIALQLGVLKQAVLHQKLGQLERPVVAPVRIGHPDQLVQRWRLYRRVDPLDVHVHAVELVPLQVAARPDELGQMADHRQGINARQDHHQQAHVDEVVLTHQIWGHLVEDVPLAQTDVRGQVVRVRRLGQVDIQSLQLRRWRQFAGDVDQPEAGSGGDVGDDEGSVWVDGQLALDGRVDAELEDLSPEKMLEIQSAGSEVAAIEHVAMAVGQFEAGICGGRVFSHDGKSTQQERRKGIPGIATSSVE